MVVTVVVVASMIVLADILMFVLMGLVMAASVMTITPVSMLVVLMMLLLPSIPSLSPARDPHRIHTPTPTDTVTRRRWCLPPNTADVDEQRLGPTQEQRQTLGHRLLADAVPAVDVDERGRGGVQGTVEDVGG